MNIRVYQVKINIYQVLYKCICCIWTYVASKCSPKVALINPIVWSPILLTLFIQDWFCLYECMSNSPPVGVGKRSAQISNSRCFAFSIASTTKPLNHNATTNIIMYQKPKKRPNPNFPFHLGYKLKGREVSNPTYPPTCTSTINFQSISMYKSHHLMLLVCLLVCLCAYMFPYYFILHARTHISVYVLYKAITGINIQQAFIHVC